MGNTSWYRFALSILLLLAVIWLFSSRFDELAYHTWHKNDLIEIGDALTFKDKSASIPPNSYVSVTGILGNKAATLSGLRAGSFRIGKYQVRNLLGSKLYVEYNEAEYHHKFSPFTRILVQGRLVPFGPDTELEKVRVFFKDYYNQAIDDKAMLIVVDEKPRSEFIYPILFALSLLLLGVSFYSSIRGIIRERKVSS